MSTPAARTRALVVGASLGGLSTALTLVARGFDVRVFDKARVFHQGAGTALTLWPNGLRALSQIDPDIVKELVARGTRRAATVHVRRDGTVAGRTPIEVESEYGMPALIVRWTDLQQVLMDRVPKGVIRGNERCIDVSVKREGATSRELALHFESGLVEVGDLVVGADGIRSVLRQQWFADGPPVYGGRMMWRSIVDGFRHPLLAPNESVFIQGQGGSFGTKHLGGESAYWSVNQVLATPPADPADGAAIEPEAMRERVLSRLAEYPELAREVVRQTDLSTHPILEYPVLEHVPLDRWVRDGVVLVGDAAHAMDPALGQGANLTFEDSVVLGDVLAGSAHCPQDARPAAIDAALQRYEERRIFRVHAVQARNALTVRTLMGGASGDSENWKKLLTGYAGGGRGRDAVFHVAEGSAQDFSRFLFAFDPLASGASMSGSSNTQGTFAVNEPASGSPLPALFDYIDGEPVRPGLTSDVMLCDANTAQPLEPQLASDNAAIERALACAERVHKGGAWRRLGFAGRAEHLDRIAAELDHEAEAIAQADSITTGAVIRQTRAFGRFCAVLFRSAAEQARAIESESAVYAMGGVSFVRREPWGPAALITPWNAPAALAAHKLASALAAGCPVIIKPSEWAPHSTALLARAIARTDLPRGVFQLVHGGASQGSQLVADPRIRAVSFTGGALGGQAIASLCARGLRPVQLELGGNNPAIVCRDADLALTATEVVAGMTQLNGQWCRALGLLIVQRELHDELHERVLAELARVKLGHSLEESSDMGPLVHRGHYDHIRAAIQRLEGYGGKAQTPTRLPALGGYFVAPTLFMGLDPAHTKEEIFGPVASMHPFDTEDEALAIANGTPYGLTGSVFSSDVERATDLCRELNVGVSKVNAIRPLPIAETTPRPAWGASGLGEEGRLHSILFFMGHRIVGRKATAS